MKASGLIVSILLVAAPAAVLLLQGLSNEGLISAGIVAAVVQVINLAVKIAQEMPKSEAQSRAINIVEPMPSTLQRILFG